MKKILSTLAVAGIAVGASAQVQSNFEFGADSTDLSVTPVSGDLINGVTATVVSQTGGQFGFATYSVLTDGTFGAEGGASPADTVIIGDAPGENQYSLILQYDFAPAAAIDEIRVFSGNMDQRTHQHYDVLGSVDSGSNFNPIISTVTTGTFGTTLYSASKEAQLTIVDDAGAASLGTFTNIQLAFYPAAAPGGGNLELRDQWNSGSGGDVDGFAAADNSTTLREIDIIGTTVPVELSTFSVE